MHKHRLQLADFGTLTKIDNDKDENKNEDEWCLTGTKYYMSEEDFQLFESHATKAKTQRIKRRDVYALGVVFVDLLMVRVEDDYDKGDLQKQDAAEYYNSHTKLKEAYGAEAEDKIINFLKLIKKMIEPHYEQRISLEKALSELKEIRVCSHQQCIDNHSEINKSTKDYI